MQDHSTTNLYIKILCYNPYFNELTKKVVGSSQTIGLGSIRILIKTNDFITIESYRLVDLSPLLHSYHSCLHTYPPFTHNSHVSNPHSLPIHVSLSVDPHHSQKLHGLFLYFITFQLVPCYYIIYMHAILHFYHPSPFSSLFSSSYFHASVSLVVVVRLSVHVHFNMGLSPRDS